jgi:prepilin peptidase CpaA
MNLLATAPLWVIVILVVLLAAAAIQDAVQLRISNITTVAVFALGLAAIAVTGFHSGLWQNFLAFGVVFAVGAILFSLGAFGGGDVKLFAAVALWTDGRGAPLLIAAILIGGGVLALFILFLRAVAPDVLRRRVATLRPRAGIPYGIAVSLGTFVAIALARSL